jgi:hypothetical protein
MGEAAPGVGIADRETCPVTATAERLPPTGSDTDRKFVGGLPVAQMIPDRLPAGASMGERRLFAVLQTLPDDYLVYYEPVIADRYPDFVILAPDLGVLVIEVKGWRPGEVLGGDTHEVVVRTRGVEARERHPVRHARDYQYALQDECHRIEPARRLLMHPDGPRQGKFTFPFGHFAVLSNLDRRQLLEYTAGGRPLADLFPETRVFTRDELLAWEGLDGTAIQDRLEPVMHYRVQACLEAG